MAHVHTRSKEEQLAIARKAIELKAKTPYLTWNGLAPRLGVSSGHLLGKYIADARAIEKEQGHVAPN